MKRQVIWCYICWDLDMFELLPPSTLFSPLFTPINLNFKKWSKVPTWHQPDSQQDTLNYHMQQKIALVLRVTLMSWFYLTKWFERVMYKSALRWPPICQKDVFDHNLWSKAHKMMILGSRSMFFHVKESDGAICFDLWPWPFKLKLLGTILQRKTTVCYMYQNEMNNM